MRKLSTVLKIFIVDYSARSDMTNKFIGPTSAIGHQPAANQQTIGTITVTIDPYFFTGRGGRFGRGASLYRYRSQLFVRFVGTIPTANWAVF